MTPKESELFLAMLFAEQAHGPLIVRLDDANRPFLESPPSDTTKREAFENLLRSVGQSFPHLVMLRRLQVVVPRVKLSVPAWVILGAMCKSPGEAVMYAFGMTRLWDREMTKSPLKVITVEHLAHTFPNGFPNDKALNALWEEQKDSAAPLGNLLDTTEVWQAPVPATPPAPPATQADFRERTDEEILDRIARIKNDDFFGAQSNDLLVRLPFEKARPFLKADAKVEDWKQQPRDRASLLKEMLDYMDFAWSKANNKRGLSASRTMDHYISWTWLLGDDEYFGDLATYEFYGKDNLVKICERYGWDSKRWDDGVRENS